jgi:hypothetical protein
VHRALGESLLCLKQINEGLDVLSSSKTKQGAIIGGAVGGSVVVVAAVVLLLFCIKRERRAQSGEGIKRAPPEQVQVPREGAIAPLFAYTQSPPLTEPVRASMFNDTPLSSHHVTTSSSPLISPLAAVDAGALQSREPVFVPSGSGTAVPADALTREQARFVYELHNLNVPAPAVASVVAEMLAGPGRDESEGRTSGGNARPLPEQPPGYD